jgi:hypothetical protein
MTDTDTDRIDGRRGRRQFLLVAAVFLLPLVAAWLYYAYGPRPEGRTNHGELVQGVTLPDPLGDVVLADRWTLMLAESADCDAACDQRLYRARQVWLSLGRKAQRVRRVVITSGGSLLTEARREVHPDLIEIPSDAVPDPLQGPMEALWEGSEVLVVDPLGNVVIRFATGYEMRDLKSDLERLLRLSRIG